MKTEDFERACKNLENEVGRIIIDLNNLSERLQDCVDKLMERRKCWNNYDALPAQIILGDAIRAHKAVKLEVERICNALACQQVMLTTLKGFADGKL